MSQFKANNRALKIVQIIIEMSLKPLANQTQTLYDESKDSWTRSPFKDEVNCERMHEERRL